MDLQNIQHLSSIIGIVGGVLGCWAFVDNYLLKFSPKFKISDKIFLKHSVEKGNGIFLKINILNTRNKIGRIDDLALRVYIPNTTKPKDYIFSAKKDLGKDFSIAAIEGGVGSIFSAISILSKTDYSVALEFNSKTISKLKIAGNRMVVDLMYLSSNGKWNHVNTYKFFSNNIKEINDQDILEYKLYDNQLSNKEANKIIGFAKSSLYQGVSGEYLGFYLMKPINFFKKIFYTKLLKIIKLISDFCKIILMDIFYKFVVFPLIKKKSKKLRSFYVGYGRPHLVLSTEEAIKIMFSEFKEIIPVINLKSDISAKIDLTDLKGNEFAISRGSINVKCYKSGDGHIAIHDDSGTISFSMELIDYIWGIRLWCVNGKIMSLKACCIKVIDFICLLASNNITRSTIPLRASIENATRSESIQVSFKNRN